jgi:hypothetical protein
MTKKQTKARILKFIHSRDLSINKTAMMCKYSSPSTLARKINGERPWTRLDLQKLRKGLKLTNQEVTYIFFGGNVSKR